MTDTEGMKTGMQELWLVRHGESHANVAAARAELELLEVIDAGWRDADVPLSDLGTEQVRERLVLTPNEEEVEILQGHAVGNFENDLITLAHDESAAVTSFGTIADPSGRSWKVGDPSSGVGTSGSGDVLAGAIAGLLARGASPAQAAAWGTWLHNGSAIRLDLEVGAVGYLARDISSMLPRVLTTVSP